MKNGNKFCIPSGLASTSPHDTSKQFIANNAPFVSLMDNNSDVMVNRCLKNIGLLVRQ